MFDGGEGLSEDAESQFDGACKLDKVIIFEADLSTFPYVRAVEAGTAVAAQVFDKKMVFSESDTEMLP